jgi:tetratricopeptide (TPR) repeat protein
MRYTLLLLLMLSLQAAVAQAPLDFELLVNRTHAERTYLLNDYYEWGIRDHDSLEVMAHVEQLRRLAHMHQDDGLRYEAEMIRCHYLVYSSRLSMENIRDECNKLIELGRVAEVKWLQIRTHSLLGHYYLNTKKEYAIGLFHLTKAAKLMDGLDARDYPLKHICNYHVALWQYKFDDVDQALQSFRKAIHLDTADVFGQGNVAPLTAIGIIFRNAGQLDSSDHYFNRALQLSTRKGNEAWAAISKGNLGENHYLRGEFDKATPLLEWDAEVALRLNDWAVASNSLNLLGKIALKRGELSKARDHFEQALDCVVRSEDYSRFAYVYPSMAKLAGKEGNADLAAAYIDSTIMVNDSLRKLKSALLSTKADQQVEMEHLELKATKLESERRQQVYMRNSIIGALMLLGVVLGLLFNRHRLKQQIRHERLTEEKRSAETALRLARAELKEFVTSLQVRNMEAASVREELQQSSILTEEDWQKFKRLFERAFAGFFERAQQRIPDLSPAEMRFAALSKLELSSTEMASMLGVGDNAIRQYRSRLRKKLNIGTKEELQDLIRSI